MTTRITLKGRLAFATIREAEKYQGTGKPRFSGTVLFDKSDVKQLKKAEAAMLAAATAKWAAKGAAFVTSLREAQKTALTNGDLKHEYDGFEGHWAVAAHTPENTPMTLVDRTARKLDKDTQTMIYSGCNVNMIVDFWAQDNEYGKRKPQRFVQLEDEVVEERLAILKSWTKMTWRNGRSYTNPDYFNRSRVSR